MMKYLKTFQWDTILFVVAILAISVVSIAIYWLLYLAGYGAHAGGVLGVAYIFVVAGVSTLVVIFIILGSAIKHFRRKESGLGLSRIAFCITLLVLWPITLTVLRSDPFTQGFQTKASEAIDVEELLIWADEQFYSSQNDDPKIVLISYNETGKLIASPEGILKQEPPDTLKELGQPYVLHFYTDREGKQVMSILWGGGFGRWGLQIGSSDLNQYNRSLDGTIIEWKPRLWVLGMHGG